ncbi:MAG: polyprenol monophosphomannose synthase [Bdellovibrio sp.]|nr:polyprenol monophosphomannose synthase [Bdellovibrio sp.]
MHTLIVIPTYNEAENILSLIEANLKITSEKTEILVVDDGSPDGTGKIVEDFSKNNPRVHVLHREKKLGLGTAYVAGFKWGLQQKVFDTFVEMDADFSHNPGYLPKMLSLLDTYDVVIGSRYVDGGGTLNWGIVRKFISRGGSFYSRMILGAPIYDFTGGFNGWKRHVLETVDIDSLRSDGYSFQIELKYRAFCRNFKIKEFPIVFEDRKVGKSKMHQKIVLEALGRVWTFRWRFHRKV